ncbi:MAG: hypothetical protein HY820_39435 [Acidobacteria bacterium]|nr:hypothetical protein [Acidobacteriota bacterium]
MYAKGLLVLAALAQSVFGQGLRAGAARVNVTPEKFPVIVNCYMLERSVEAVTTPLHAKALVLDDGKVRMAMVVVDVCMMPRELIDRAKEAASKRTGIPVNRMMISATHTHSAPAAMACLGSEADPEFVELLVRRIPEAIEKAASGLQPARVGWAVEDDWEHTHTRRWIYKPDKMLTDPFGFVTARANMHPGYQNPNVISPSGPVDPGLSVLGVQTAEGKPLALLANYSQHYYGTAPVSADYFGVFSDRLTALVGGDEEFVGILSQGTSGDQMWMDYSKEKKDAPVEEYVEGLAQSGLRAWERIQWRESVSLAMEEQAVRFRRRLADGTRMEWARKLVAEMDGRKPKSQPEVFAREQVLIAAEPARELKLQAIRIGDLGITAIPNEVFAITGLKLKMRSPLETTFNIELANGAEGYIPPPEQHALGGYTSWAARSAGLVVETEPAIVEILLGLLEKVSGKPRRKGEEPEGTFAKKVLETRPFAYFRMGEMEGTELRDIVWGGRASIQGNYARGLPGPQSEAFSGKAVNRAVQLVGGRMVAPTGILNRAWSAEMWFWNGWEGNALLLGIGKDEVRLRGGRLVVGEVTGTGEVPLRTWQHLVMVHDSKTVRVYRNGKLEVEAAVEESVPAQAVFGEEFEGRIDEVAIYSRALDPEDVVGHYQAAGVVRGPLE